MKRLLTSVAMSLALATGAYAASDGEVLSDHAFQPASDFYGSDLIGMRVYVPDLEDSAGDGDGLENIGEVNDLIVTSDAGVAAAIVGVGGFLGIGEKDVALDMAALEFRSQEDGSRFIVVGTTREALEAAPIHARGDVAGTESGLTTTPPAQPAPPAETGAAPTTPPADGSGSVALAPAPDAGAVSPPVDETDAAKAGAEATEELAAEREPLTAPEVERENYTAAPTEALTAETLQGAVVYGPNDEEVGEIEELQIDASGAVEHAVIDVGGFLGMGEKPVLVGMSELTILANAEGDDVRVYIDSSKDALMAQPEYRG